MGNIIQMRGNIKQRQCIAFVETRQCLVSTENVLYQWENAIPYICRGGVLPALPKINIMLKPMWGNIKPIYENIKPIYENTIERQGSALSLRGKCNSNTGKCNINSNEKIFICRDKALPCLSYNCILSMGKLHCINGKYIKNAG